MAPDQINNTFTYHAPNAFQQEKYVKIREKSKELAILINELCPESREKSLAFTYIQLASMLANASIAINT